MPSPGRPYLKPDIRFAGALLGACMCAGPKLSAATAEERDSATCPPGAAQTLLAGGGQNGQCQCSYGYQGNLVWSVTAGHYFGHCERTPCPLHASPGRYAGTCTCVAPYRGSVVWRPADAAHGLTPALPARFVGNCSWVPCPANAAMAPGEKHDARIRTMLKHMFDINGVSRIPRCECKTGFVGGFVWEPESQSFAGQCVVPSPCPAGFTGAHMEVTFSSTSQASAFARANRPVGGSASLLLEKAASGIADSVLEGIAPFGAAGQKESKGGRNPYGIPAVRMVGTCKRARCPAHAEVDVSSGLCRCKRDYNGTLRWDADRGAYSGHCMANFACPRHAVHRKIRISTARSRLGCVCKDGYIGGSTAWSPDGRRWWRGGECRLAECPLNAQRRALSHRCQCLPGFSQFSLAWSRERGAYVGECVKLAERQPDSKQCSGANISKGIVEVRMLISDVDLSTRGDAQLRELAELIVEDLSLAAGVPPCLVEDVQGNRSSISIASGHNLIEHDELVPALVANCRVRVPTARHVESVASDLTSHEVRRIIAEHVSAVLDPLSEALGLQQERPVEISAKPVVPTVVTVPSSTSLMTASGGKAVVTTTGRVPFSTSLMTASVTQGPLPLPGWSLVQTGAALALLCGCAVAALLVNWKMSSKQSGSTSGDGIFAICAAIAGSEERQRLLDDQESHASGFSSEEDAGAASSQSQRRTSSVHRRRSTRLTSSVGLDGGIVISGAVGNNAGAINGTYRLASREHAGHKMWQKVDEDDEFWLCYSERFKTWNVCPTSHIDPGGGFMVSKTKGLDNPLESTRWKVAHSSEWEEQDVTVEAVHAAGDDSQYITTTWMTSPTM